VATALLLAAPGCTGGRVAVTPVQRPAVVVGPPPSAQPTVPVSVEPTEEPLPPPGEEPLDLQRVLTDTEDILAYGVRPVGSSAERKATEHMARRLREMGYAVRVEQFPVPGGTSRNLVVRSAGKDSRTIALGAHIDSKRTTPGANDDASGCAILLEVARQLAAKPSYASVDLIFFGGEEYNDGSPRDHHRGSRFRVKQMSSAERKRTVGMISVDVVAYGSKLHARTMGVGPRTMSDLLLKEGKRLGVKITYLKDPGKTGWSDHEPYEKAGIPAVWLERLQDPAYHKKGDTTDHLQREPLRESGQFVLDVLRGLDEAKLDALRE